MGRKKGGRNKPKVHWSKKLRWVPGNVSGKKVKGAVRIRPISFHMDKTIDKHVISGGGIKTVVVGGGRSGRKRAKTIADARIRVMQKHQERKRGR